MDDAVDAPAAADAANAADADDAENKSWPTNIFETKATVASLPDPNRYSMLQTRINNPQKKQNHLLRKLPLQTTFQPRRQ